MLKNQRQQLGKEGEDIAADFLKAIGFVILERDFKYGRKDIDIICRDGKTIVFVEVKAGRSRSFGTPLERVHQRKQKNIAQVAKSFMQQKDCAGYDFRFDVVAIDDKRVSKKIKHLRNAFMVEELD
jgi:putative endonuclease